MALKAITGWETYVINNVLCTSENSKTTPLEVPYLLEHRIGPQIWNTESKLFCCRPELVSEPWTSNIKINCFQLDNCEDSSLWNFVQSIHVTMKRNSSIRNIKCTKTLAATGLFLSATTIFVLSYYLNSDEQDMRSGSSFNQINFSPDNHSSNNIGKATPHIPSSDQHYICPVFDGGIGNQMFQFASSYGIARSKNMKVLISERCKLMTIFNLNVTIVKDISVCKTFRILREIQNSVYDKRMTSFDPSTNVRLTIYLQSYRYFDTFKSELRKQLTFRHEIKTKADLILDENLRRLSITCHANNVQLVDSIKNSKYSQCYSASKEKVTLIGIHVRRGDWLKSPHPQLGFQTASKEYLHRAVEWYQKRFKNIIFILATNGMNWTRENLPKNITVVYLEENSPPVDMAVLASCEHFLSTVGTFGWWTGWLTSGNVTYFKWPARENTQFRRAFGKDFSDHFYPSWIGL